MKLTVFLLLLTGIVACKDSARIPDDFDYGKVENQVYRNQYFGFEIPLPSDWALQSREEMEKLRQKGRAMIERSNKDMAGTLKASEINSAMLLSIFRYKPDSVTGEFNHSLTVLAENISKIPGIKTATDYLENTQKLITQSRMPYQTSGIHHQKVGGRDFDIMTITMNLQGLSIEQLYYVTVIRDFVVGMIISYGNGRQEQELKDIVSGIRFK
ncbi:MAG: hypothetical protein ABW019_09365 [Chitinophagaceae bacterium]